MKTFNKIKRFSLLLLSMAVVIACENDGDKIYLSELETNELMATASEVALSQDNANQQVLSLAWSTQALTVSNPEMQAPDILATTLQISTQNDFASNVVESVESNLSKSYTGFELNTVAKNLKLDPDVPTPLYFRLQSSVGNNMEPVYSNVLTITVTPYSIDMSVGFILDSNKADTGITLYSPESDSIYTGFMGATAWYNFYMKEGDGTIWGNFPVDNNAFALASTSDSWNCWFPGQSGCYYVTVDTKKKEWSSLLLPKLTVSGDIAGEMTFDRPNVKWTYVFTAASTNSLKIQLSTTGNLYNYTTSTDDAAAIATPVAFTQSGDKIALAQQAGEITVSVPATGECTLVLDLSDPKNWKCTVESGSTAPVEIPQYLYVPGIDDGISGSWTFDNFLNLYDEDGLGYVGVINVNSLYGYSLNIENGNWNDKYVFAGGDAYSGTLVFQGSDNIPAPAPGVYLLDVSLKDLTYNLTGVGNEIYVSGLNDVWDFTTVLSATQTPGIYSGTITVNAASSYGFQIHLDTSWAHYYGGSSGNLYYKGSNITDDASLSIGTHQLTVDLIHGKYEIE